MSSIYRKGRDGYFYYQAYIYNSITKKKDKRIFHSLGTQDLKLAKAKKRDLDDKYENYKKKNKTIWSSKWRHKYFLIFIIIIILYALIGLSSNKSSFNQTKSDIILDVNQYNIQNVLEIKDKKMLDEYSELKNNDNLSKSLSIEKPIKDSLKFKKNKKEVRSVDYKIKKEIPMGANFNQIKINAVVNLNYQTDSLKGICRHIRSNYPEYSNIVICLYLNNKDGNAFATGEKIGLSLSKKRDSWLALFSFNEVEGEYFDNNPTGYLGKK